MKIYRSHECLGCAPRAQCTTHPRGRTISRREHEEILEDMRQRVASNKHKVKMRQWLSEHPFGTMKRGFNQGYLLLKGLAKVAATDFSFKAVSYHFAKLKG